MTVDEVYKIGLAIITSLGGGALIIFAFSSWLGKVWASRILETEKHQLELLRREHEVRFSKLHLERAEAIKEIAQKLQELDDSLHTILKEFQPIEDPDINSKITDFIRIHSDYIQAYKKNRIYFTKETEERMHGLAICSRDTYIDITTYPVDPEDTEYQFIPDLLQNRADAWKAARKKFYGDIEQIKTTLESEFRVILGVEQ